MGYWLEIKMMIRMMIRKDGDIDGVDEGVTEGVTDWVGVTDGVTEGVTDSLGVADGVTEGVIDAVTVIDGVCDGVTDGVTETEGVIAMNALRCPAKNANINQISGGEKRRVALCKLLLEKPDMILLDEPTNHLDAESVSWLETYLKEYKGTVVAITHDRYFLDNVAQRILELDRGRAYPYEGNYSTYLETKASRLKVEGQKDAKRAKRLAEELDWVRQNAKGRQAKSKARLARYEEMAAEAEKARKLEFEEIQIPMGPRLGNIVVEVDKLSKGFGERLLIDELSFSLPRNGIVGVIGPNGAGKTTLFKMILGQEQPDSGSIKVGETVKISYVDQSRSGIDPKKSLWEVVSDGLDFIKVEPDPKLVKQLRRNVKRSLKYLPKNS